MHTVRLFCVVFLSLGCRPPEAPEDYEALVGYIFEHTVDEDDTALLAGLDNLSNWLSGENLLLAQEGMSITNLPEDAVTPLAGHAHSREGLAGVSMVTESG